ncbi:DUF1353 domain-containing protein [Thalassobaculum sp.]|uniref:DUF1353 domain-containing protein n=1 Tax=Thalassobaculum sp. TaxID=2022740 RepID=UPI0032EC3399
MKLNGRDWRLASSYRFRSSAFGTIEVPAGFETDLASVPWFARCFVAVDGEWTKPAVVHDWLYSPAAAGLRLTRRQADAAFLDALRVRGVSPLLGRVLWLAVRLGGRRAFRRAAGAS